MKKNLKFLNEKKLSGVPVSAVTAYDFPTACALDEAGIDIVLVGDSLGTNELGYASEREVTISDMVHHTKAVCRGVKSAFVIADLPYGRADSIEDAMWCAKILVEAGADGVKIEGWGEKAGIVKKLADAGLIICAHLGYNPQIHDKPTVFGKDEALASDLASSAKLLTDAGARLAVFEMIPKELAGKITKSLPVPTIGIGSGNLCDGQVLVINDLLGLSPRLFKHVRKFANLKEIMYEALKDYGDAVKTREFPGDDNSW